jgi:hypothetical protein
MFYARRLRIYTKELVQANFYEQKYFLWICIFVGAITLFFFSWKLLQEKKNGE